MHIEATILIIIVIASGLGFIGLVAIFTILFLRKQGTTNNHRKQKIEYFGERKTYSPVPFDDTEMEYTTTNIQPESKGDMSTFGYPHNVQVLLVLLILQLQIVCMTSTKTLEEEVLPLQPDDSDSSEDIEEPEVSPTLTVLLRYDHQRSYLFLKLLNMFDLPKRRDKTEVNSFLEIRPHFGQNPIQTDIYPDSCNPKLEETFEFEVERDDLRTQTIEFVIMDAREYSNRSIGFVELSIDNLNVADLMAEKEVTTALTVGKPKMQRSLSEGSLLSNVLDSGKEMQFTTSMAEGLDIAKAADQQHSPNRKTKATLRLAKDWEYVAGMDTMIFVSLYYARDAQKLVFGIIKVANLKVLPDNKKPDSYVLVNIYVRNKMKLKRKTTVKKQELNPIYNQMVEFPLQEMDLNAVKLVVVVKNNGPTRKGNTPGKTHSLHEAVFGESCTGSFLEHWKAGIASSARPVTKWHILK